MSDTKDTPAGSDRTGASKKECAECSRRRFFARLGVGSLVVAGAGTGVFSYEYFSPNVLFEASPIVKAGKPDQFPLNEPVLDPKNAIYVVNSDAGFYALSAICTHLGCLTAWKPDQNQIACPCHGSRFNRDGVRIAGPAPKPLPWFKVTLSEDGYLMVDRSTIVKPYEFLKV